MNPDQLRALISQPESATLEFKQEFYLTDHPDQKEKEKHRGELIKDVLSLANGSAATAGAMAYLIIGPTDVVQGDGSREVFDVVTPVPDQRRILKWVNGACDPSFDAITCEAAVLDGKRLIVITILPTPYLYETTRPLLTRGQTYTEHVVLYRENAKVEVANARQREVMLLLKQRRYADQYNAPPRFLGSVVGAVVGGLMGDQYSRKPPPGGRAVQAIGGGVVGGLVGAGLGSSYRDLRRFWFEISPQSPPRKAIWIALLAVFVLGSQSVTHWLLRLIGKGMEQMTHHSDQTL
ncbi:MAG: hypothetical protein HGA19_10185 [Oscillochloris sp.]|nr:hypothetical protein [Oscillochloris sp.]